MAADAPLRRRRSREYGLPGLDNISYGLIMQELERGDSGLRSFVSVQSGLVMYPDLRLRLEGAEGPVDPEAREGARRSAASG